MSAEIAQLASKTRSLGAKPNDQESRIRPIFVTGFQGADASFICLPIIYISLSVGLHGPLQDRSGQNDRFFGHYGFQRSVITSGAP